MLNYNLLSIKPSVVIVDSKEINNDRLDSMFYHSKYIKNKSNLIENKIEMRDLEDISINMNAPVGWKGIPSSSYLPNGEGVPLIRGKNIKNLLLDLDSLIGVEERIYKEQPEIQAQNNDIILTRVGTIGRVCRVPNNLEKIAMGQNLTRVELDKSIVKSEYVLAYMASKYGQLQMDRYAYGGVQPSLTNKNIKRLQIPIPSHEIQKYIGDKVRKAEKLREEAKTLREKAENELEKVLKSESFSFNKQKYLFTNKVTERRIDAWYYKPIFERITDYLEEFTQVKKLNEITKIGKGFSYSSNKELGNIPYLRISDIRNYRFNIEETLGIPERIYNKREDKRLENFDIVLAITGATIGKAAVVVKDNNEKMTLSADTAYLRVTNQDEIYPLYLLTFLKTKFGQLQIKQGITGATNRHLGLEDIAAIKVPIIDIDKQKSIHDKILKSIKNENQSKQLIEEAKQDVEDLIEGDLEINN